MTEWLIDAMAVLGLCAATAGIYLQFGVGYALIFGGIACTALALNAARLLNAANNTATGRHYTVGRGNTRNS